MNIIHKVITQHTKYHIVAQCMIRYHKIAQSITLQNECTTQNVMPKKYIGIQEQHR